MERIQQSSDHRWCGIPGTYLQTTNCRITNTRHTISSWYLAYWWTGYRTKEQAFLYWLRFPHPGWTLLPCTLRCIVYARGQQRANHCHLPYGWGFTYQCTCKTWWIASWSIFHVHRRCSRWFGSPRLYRSQTDNQCWRHTESQKRRRDIVHQDWSWEYNAQPIRFAIFTRRPFLCRQSVAHQGKQSLKRGYILSYSPSFL